MIQKGQGVKSWSISPLANQSIFSAWAGVNLFPLLDKAKIYHKIKINPITISKWKSVLPGRHGWSLIPFLYAKPFPHLSHIWRLFRPLWLMSTCCLSKKFVGKRLSQFWHTCLCSSFRCLKKSKKKWYFVTKIVH